MQSRLSLCASYLKEVEDKLEELLKDHNGDQSQILEAISFVQQAQKGVTEAQSRITTLHT